MRNSTWSFTVVCIFFVIFALPAAAVKARDTDEKSLTLAAAESSKQRHINACRARYRDCLKLNKIPAFECQYIYQDCMNHIY